MRRRMFCSIIILILLKAHSISAQEKFIFSTFPVENPIAEICEPIIRAAYKKIGIEAVIRHYPPARSIQLANEGFTDGELFRSVRLNGKFSNLLMVPVPITYTKVVVFTKHIRFDVKGWDSLKPYNIGIQRGFKLSEERTRGMQTYSATAGQIFKMLDAGRVDIVVSTKLGGLCYLQSLRIEGIKILSPPLETDNVHHFLHKKHIKIVPEITAILENMKKTGEIDAIRKKAEKTLFE